MARGVDDGHVVPRVGEFHHVFQLLNMALEGNLLGGLELPESNVDGDTTLALGLQLVHHPGVLEGTLQRSHQVKV